MRIRLVVADQSEARFYDLSARRASPAPAGARLQLIEQLADPKAHLHDRDFSSDRPGRVFDHAPAPAKRRGATGHHSTGGERRPRKHEAAVFAQQIAGVLERARRADEFDRLLIMAAPAFLGLLRKALPPSVRATVAAEIRKDLVHESPEALQAHVSADVLRALLPA